MHHTRQNYITQIKTACRETGTVIPAGLDKLPDYELLLRFNNLLVKWGCQPLTQDELELELL